MNLSNFKRRIQNYWGQYFLDHTLYICAFIVFAPVFIKILLGTFGSNTNRGSCKVLTFNNNNGQTYYVTGVYLGGPDRDLDSYYARDTFTVEKEAVNFMEQQNKRIEAAAKKRQDAEFRLVDIKP